MHPQLITWLLVLAALVAVVRVYFTIRRVSQKKTDDWDENLVKNLRTQGGDPFSPQDVDFFFDLPDQNACEQVAALLGPRAFTVDFRRVDPERGDRFTLHALKSMRISVHEMQSLRREFAALAVQHNGRYDGWATSGITRAAVGRDDSASAKRR